MPLRPFRVAIIGGGPSGLATLKTVLDAPRYKQIKIEARLFEESPRIGGTFLKRVYENAELVSSKYLTAFSDFRIPRSLPDFLSAEEYLKYLEDYVDRFKLQKHIECSRPVILVQNFGNHVHCLTIDRPATRSGHAAGGTQRPELWACDAVAVCSGLHNRQHMPLGSIPGMEECLRHQISLGRDNETVTIMHSSRFKARSQFGDGKTVLILGAGETAMDIAHLAVTSLTKDVVLAHKNGFFVAPKITVEPIVLNGLASAGPGPVPNKPTDCATASLFDTAYVPPILQRGPLLWACYDAFVQGMSFVLSGTRRGYDQWVGELPNARRHADSFFFVKSMKAIPYISEQYRSTSIWNLIRAWFINMKVERTAGRKIELAPWPAEIDRDGVVRFEDNGRPEAKRMAARGGIKADIIIFATGYEEFFPFLPPEEGYPTLKDCYVRGIYRKIEERLAYIGFARPSFGAIPPLAELQAQLWVHKLLASYGAYEHHPDTSKVAVKLYELDYKLRCRGMPHHAQRHLAVDHEAYAYQLALDMGAAPAWWYVLRAHGWKVFYTWAMGPNFNTKFRLIGPWSSPDVAEEAAEVMRGELFDVVKRTGGGVFFFWYTIVPLLIFGPLSIAIQLSYCWAWLLDLVRSSRR